MQEHAQNMDKYAYYMHTQAYICTPVHIYDHVNIMHVSTYVRTNHFADEWWCSSAAVLPCCGAAMRRRCSAALTALPCCTHCAAVLHSLRCLAELAKAGLGNK